MPVYHLCQFLMQLVQSDALCQFFVGSYTEEG